MIITVSGPHGTGKSTYAARLAEALRIRHASAGALFRRIAKEKRISLEELGEMALEDPSIDKLVDDTSLGSIEDTAKLLVSAAIMVRRARKAQRKSTKP